MSRRRDFNMGEKIAILHLRVLELEGRLARFERRDTQNV